MSSRNYLYYIELSIPLSHRNCKKNCVRYILYLYFFYYHAFVINFIQTSSRSHSTMLITNTHRCYVDDDCTWRMILLHICNRGMRAMKARLIPRRLRMIIPHRLYPCAPVSPGSQIFRHFCFSYDRRRLSESPSMQDRTFICAPNLNPAADNSSFRDIFLFLHRSIKTAQATHVN